MRGRCGMICGQAVNVDSETGSSLPASNMMSKALVPVYIGDELLAVLWREVGCTESMPACLSIEVYIGSGRCVMMPKMYSKKGG